MSFAAIASLPPRSLAMVRILLVAATLLVLAACSSTPSEPVGPALHRVQPSETLSSIARRYGQSVDNLVRWNKLSNPNQIHVGQVLQVSANPQAAGHQGIAAGSQTASSNTTGSGKVSLPPAAGTPQVRPSAPAPRATAAAPANAAKLVWPAKGKAGRASGGRPGITIAGAAGTPVHAAAAGRVAYVGAGLRGYGNLVIVDHGGNYLTVYAHNRRLVVREGARVTQGQKIAEMGDTDASQVALYFEVRHKGEPVDPLRVLPKR